jgi:ankyrin repeat protein
MRFLVIISLFISSTLCAQQKDSANQLLLAAALHGNVQDIKKALELGADINAKNEMGATALNMVCKLSYEFLVTFLIEKGATVNSPNNDHIYPLHYAVEYDNVAIVKALLKNGADINVLDGIQETPLHWAGWTGNIRAAKLLLKQGANPYKGNNSGVTPIDLTIRQEHKKLQHLFQKRKYRHFKESN